MVFEKGDSNRTRNAYEKILHEKLTSAVLNPHKKNKHISVGRCRHLAIVHGIALPPYKELQDAGFELGQVDRSLWCIPTDCQRFAKKVAEEGFCYGNRCDTCMRLFDDREGAASSSTASYTSSSPTPSSHASITASPRPHPSEDDEELGMDEGDLLLLESSRLVHRVLVTEELMRPSAVPRAQPPRARARAQAAAAAQQQQQKQQQQLQFIKGEYAGGMLLDDATEKLLLEGTAEDALLLGGGEVEVDLAKLGEILAHGRWSSLA